MFLWFFRKYTNAESNIYVLVQSSFFTDKPYACTRLMLSAKSTVISFCIFILIHQSVKDLP